MKEIWKDVVGSNGKYQISNLGNIRNKFGLMKPQMDRGYYKVRLILNGIRKGYSIHRLVCMAFIDNKENKKCVNHKDGIKTNNNVNNLEWCTYRENIIHAYKNNLQTSKAGVLNGRCKINEYDVLCIKNSNEHDTILANKYGISRTAIRNIKIGKSWNHIK